MYIHILYTRWFKYDRDDLCVNKLQFVPVIFEQTLNMHILYTYLLYVYIYIYIFIYCTGHFDFGPRATDVGVSGIDSLLSKFDINLWHSFFRDRLTQ
jgi:hypothetical protein